MRDDYKIQGPTAPLKVDVEATIVEKLKQMSQHTKLSVDELTSTALKRFISQHKDFLPPSGK